jgi:GNAT superfamily N-acetyltransferase
MGSITLRPARPEETAPLSALALRSKAFWGYDRAFLAACRPGLTVTRQQLEREHVVVAQADPKLLGFYALATAPPHGELTELWVDPPRIGTGLGRALFEHAVATAPAVHSRTGPPPDAASVGGRVSPMAGPHEGVVLAVRSPH